VLSRGLCEGIRVCDEGAECLVDLSRSAVRSRIVNLGQVFLTLSGFVLTGARTVLEHHQEGREGDQRESQEHQ
jgi:hypothetical protein